MIHSFKYAKRHTKDVGEVISPGESWVKVQGFKKGFLGEAVSFETDEKGLIFGLEDGTADVLVFSRNPLKNKTKVARTAESLKISVGDGILGASVNSLGYYLHPQKKPSEDTFPRIIDVPPPGVSLRKKITENLITGVPVVDFLVPLGKGQRELVIGDMRTGKTHLLSQVVISQAQEGTICVYCLIGKRKAEVKRLENLLREKKVLSKSVIVAATSYDPPAMVYLAPFAAMAIAEHFRDEGRDTLVVLDDMTAHANYYRELMLTAGHFPGRESYPSDIFHVQSRIIERAGNFIIDDKQASITCLPVAETQDGDLTGYIPTNLMSMTDGHIFFDKEMYFQGVRPAINIFLSVTRVGRQTQHKLIRRLSEQLFKAISDYEEVLRFVRFGPEMTEKIKRKLEKGERVLAFFRRVGSDPCSFEIEFLEALLALKTSNYTHKIASVKNPGELAQSLLKEQELEAVYKKLENNIRL